MHYSLGFACFIFVLVSENCTAFCVCVCILYADVIVVLMTCVCHSQHTFKVCVFLTTTLSDMLHPRDMLVPSDLMIQH